MRFTTKTQRSQRFLLILFSVLLVRLWLGTSAEAALNQSALQRAVRESAIRTQYEISLEIKPGFHAYSGHQKVKFTNHQNQPTPYLLFFLYPNDPSIAKAPTRYMIISNVKAAGVPVKVVEDGPSMRVPLSRPLEKGRSVEVEFDFDATIPVQKGTKDLFSQTLDELMSFLNQNSAQESDYGVFSANKDILNMGLWYPALSKYDKNGWDEEKYAGIGDVSYFDPADFKVAIKIPGNFHVATTGSLMKRVPQNDGSVEYHVESVMTRDFEVELSARFEEMARIEGRTTIRSFFLPEHRESGETVAEAAVKSFRYYQQTFGAYPYTELNVVEAPLYGGAGGVEFPGIVTISSMLYKESSADLDQDLLKQLMANNSAFDRLLEFVVAHEVAHQWWNAVIGSNSKKYPFIDEAMANYSAVLYFEQYYGREAAEQQMAMQMKANYQLHRMVGGSDKAVMAPASSFKGPLEYSAIVYGKGALYFDRLRFLMGDAAFFRALRQYYDQFWFKIAEPEDFTRIAKLLSPDKKEQIENLFVRWMKENHGDEDVGKGTFEALLKTVLGSNPDLPQSDELMKQLKELIPQ